MLCYILTHIVTVNHHFIVIIVSVVTTNIVKSGHVKLNNYKIRTSYVSKLLDTQLFSPSDATQWANAGLQNNQISLHQSRLSVKFRNNRFKNDNDIDIRSLMSSIMCPIFDVFSLSCSSYFMNYFCLYM